MKEIQSMPIWKKDSYFIDTNVLLYAIGKKSDYKHACLRVLKNINLDKFSGVTNCEVFQEILHRYWKTNKTMAMDLIKLHKTITSRDAIHAATMVNNGIKKIITADRHFDKIKGIERIDPKEF